MPPNEGPSQDGDDLTSATMRPNYPGVLLDRDGVLIENVDEYVRGWGDVRLLEPSLRALAGLRSPDIRIVIATNQSAVGRGLITQTEAEDINRRLVGEITARGGRVDGVFMCPHSPEDGCSCRKPQPGLLLQAAEALDLDLDRSILVGDALTDIQAGRAAGVGTVALVRTGLGALEESRLPSLTPLQVPVFDNLEQALAHLLPPGPSQS